MGHCQFQSATAVTFATRYINTKECILDKENKFSSILSNNILWYRPSPSTRLYKCQASQLLAVDFNAFVKKSKDAFLAIQNHKSARNWTYFSWIRLSFHICCSSLADILYEHYWKNTNCTYFSSVFLNIFLHKVWKINSLPTSPFSLILSQVKNWDDPTCNHMFWLSHFTFP
jgi:sensor histidine kinase YesM